MIRAALAPLVLGLSVPALAQTDGPPPETVEAVQALMAEHAIPAVGAAFVRDGELVWSASWGAPEDALFNVASLAKPVAAETVLRLASQGQLDLDAPLSEVYVDPDIADDPRAQALTLRLALSHQTGFPNWRYQTDGVLSFQSDPGTRPGYSGEGYEYAGEAAQAWTGMGFDALIRDQVLSPAGASDHVVLGADPLQDARRLTPHRADGSPAPLSITERWSAADDLWTTPEGYGRILASLMRADGLSPALAETRNTITFDEAPMACNPQGPIAEFCAEAMGFGLGRVVFEYESGPVIWHGGGDEGERALMFYSPATQTGMVIMSNSAHGGQVFTTLATLAEPDADFIAFLNFQANQGN